MDMEKGRVIVFSDAHFWPDDYTTAYKALLEVIKEFKPKVVIANGDVFAGLEAPLHQDAVVLNCYPTPADQQMDVAGFAEGEGVALFDVYAMNGRLVQRSSARLNGAFTKRIDTSSLGAGNYILQVTRANGDVLGVKQFAVAR
jgi:hypothetical protein